MALGFVVLVLRAIINTNPTPMTSPVAPPTTATNSVATPTPATFLVREDTPTKKAKEEEVDEAQPSQEEEEEAKLINEAVSIRSYLWVSCEICKQISVIVQTNTFSPLLLA